MEELQRSAGTQLDPRMVSAFLAYYWDEFSGHRLASIETLRQAAATAQPAEVPGAAAQAPRRVAAVRSRATS